MKRKFALFEASQRGRPTNVRYRDVVKKNSRLQRSMFTRVHIWSPVVGVVDRSRKRRVFHEVHVDLYPKLFFTLHREKRLLVSICIDSYIDAIDENKEN